MNVLKIDKGWTSHNRLSREYADGVESFLNFALRNSKDRNLIPCPCAKCANTCMMSVDIIRAHLFCHGMDLTYHKWIWHGERVISSKSDDEKDGVRNNIENGDVDDPIDMVHDAYDTYTDNPRRTKDGIAARLDLVEMNVRTELAPNVGNKRTFLPPACYTLSKEEKRNVCASLSGMKGPIQPDHKQCGYYVLRFMKEIIDGFEEDGSVSLKSL
ncbi:hypothetical protein C2S51_010743, partial [Perilla frutescens var. frutescens]